MEFRIANSLRRALVVAAALFALVAIAAPAAGTAGVGNGGALTLKASKKELKSSKTTDLSGTLSGVFSGNSGKTITLYATFYPYDVEQVVTTTTTDGNGDFAFPNQDPGYNVRYRVGFDGDALDGDASSGMVQIFRFPSGDSSIDVTPDGDVVGRLDFFYPAEVQPEYYVGRKDLYWYFGKTKAKRFKRVDRVRFEDTSQGVGGDSRYRLPRSRKGYRFFYFPCVEAPAMDIGIGNDKPSKCPRSFKNRRGKAAPTRAFSGLGGVALKAGP